MRCSAKSARIFEVEDSRLHGEQLARDRMIEAHGTADHVDAGSSWPTVTRLAL
jgi:hypothetical protein